MARLLEHFGCETILGVGFGLPYTFTAPGSFAHTAATTRHLYAHLPTCRAAPWQFCLSTLYEWTGPCGQLPIRCNTRARTHTPTPAYTTRTPTATYFFTWSTACLLAFRPSYLCACDTCTWRAWFCSRTDTTPRLRAPPATVTMPTLPLPAITSMHTTYFPLATIPALLTTHLLYMFSNISFSEPWHERRLMLPLHPICSTHTLLRARAACAHLPTPVWFDYQYHAHHPLHLLPPSPPFPYLYLCPCATFRAPFLPRDETGLSRDFTPRTVRRSYLLPSWFFVTAAGSHAPLYTMP